MHGQVRHYVAVVISADGSAVAAGACLLSVAASGCGGGRKRRPIATATHFDIACDATIDHVCPGRTTAAKPSPWGLYDSDDKEEEAEEVAGEDDANKPLATLLAT